MERRNLRKVQGSLGVNQCRLDWRTTVDLVNEEIDGQPALLMAVLGWIVFFR